MLLTPYPWHWQRTLVSVPSRRWPTSSPDKPRRRTQGWVLTACRRAAMVSLVPASRFCPFHLPSDIYVPYSASAAVFPFRPHRLYSHSHRGTPSETLVTWLSRGAYLVPAISASTGCSAIPPRHTQVTSHLTSRPRVDMRQITEASFLCCFHRVLYLDPL